MKRIISVAVALMTAAMSAGTLFPASVSAANVSFTGNEWTGRNGAEDVFAVNREAASCNPVPYQNTDAAVNAVWDYNAREQSDYLQMLTGKDQDWDLVVVQNSEQAQTHNSATVKISSSSMMKVKDISCRKPAKFSSRLPPKSAEDYFGAFHIIKIPIKNGGTGWD